MAMPDKKSPEDPDSVSSGISRSTLARDTSPIINDSYPLNPAHAALDLPELDSDEKPSPYPLRFGPWWRMSSARDSSIDKTRILPCAAACIMPVTVLFVLTSTEANWIQSEPGFRGHRINKATGYVVGNAIATALAFGSALTIAFRQLDVFRKYASLTVAMASQVLINLVLGSVCMVIGAVYQRNIINNSTVWITPEYVCVYVGGALAYLQAVLLIVDYIKTPNFNQRGHGMGAAMQGAIGLSNLVNIWTGFGSLVFSNVENKRIWHAYNSCFNSWVTMITTGSTVLTWQTNNSKVFILFWLPIGLLIMFVYFVCFARGVIERFDAKPLRRITEAEDRLRAVYREKRRGGNDSSELVVRVAALEAQAAKMHADRLRLFFFVFLAMLFVKIASWLLGSIIFTLTEPGWSYWDSLIFVFFNILTVGMQGRVPFSAVGMPLYHALTYLDILITAAIDGILFHLLYNLVPWSQYGLMARTVLASVVGKVTRKHRPIDVESAVEEQGAQPEDLDHGLKLGKSIDQLEAILDAATQMRSLLVQNSASSADVAQYDRLIEAAESRLDDLVLQDKKSQ
ncbi:Potassium channel [Linderina macrospora]|uniref:Potassium channel n=1 Tax=Linderina macrospora TaxID=4868 RepID=A0ACC1JAU9_9FUNG|nr:Potassium channel [Linderina macrospora]